MGLIPAARCAGGSAHTEASNYKFAAKFLPHWALLPEFLPAALLPRIEVDPATARAFHNRLALARSAFKT